ncbi:DUF6134 family protein [Thalassospira sp.]|uniref:DUF6134 family protein n=1 Tax=Thalassospira sp. TaxID=1912094 RepID=UPI00273698FA|nr:DUF6134 family protein [Thalassospira sp.]MDP2699465.1 DUF6134 family protein [Thalassospira sp.]
MTVLRLPGFWVPAIAVIGGLIPPAMAADREIAALTPDIAQKSCSGFDPIARYGDQLRFEIRRGDLPVGQHVVTFNQGRDGVQVVAESRIDISFLGLNVYQFRYRSESIWQGDDMASLAVTVDDDGDQTSLNARRKAGKLIVENTDGTETLPGDIFPTDHWHCGVLDSTQVLNTITGRANDVTITRIGTDPLPTPDGPLSAAHYAYRGQLETNAWYDDAGRWAGLRFVARDGSEITYRCLTCTPTKDPQ